MDHQNSPLSEQFLEVASGWVDAEAAASLLEDTKTAVLNQKMAMLGEMPVNKAEMIIKASPEWHDHLKKIVDARTHANRLKIKMEYLRLKFNEWQSHEANERTIARL